MVPRGYLHLKNTGTEGREKKRANGKKGKSGKKSPAPCRAKKSTFPTMPGPHRRARHPGFWGEIRKKNSPPLKLPKAAQRGKGKVLAPNGVEMRSRGYQKHDGRGNRGTSLKEQGDNNLKQSHRGKETGDEEREIRNR